MVQLPINLTLIKPHLLQEGNQYDLTMIEYGPIINHCLSLYWKCVLYIFTTTTTTNTAAAAQESSLIRVGSGDLESVANLCVDYMDIVMGGLATPLNCLATLVTKVCKLIIIIPYSRKYL